MGRLLYTVGHQKIVVEALRLQIAGVMGHKDPAEKSTTSKDQLLSFAKMQLAIRTLKRHKRQSAKRGKTKRWQKHFGARQKSRTRFVFGPGFD